MIKTTGCISTNKICCKKIKGEVVSYPAAELRRNETIAHHPVTVDAVSVEKSKKYTKLIFETRAPTRIDMKTPKVR